MVSAADDPTEDECSSADAPRENVAQTAAGMLCRQKAALEPVVRCRVTNLDIHLPIPSVFLADRFPEQPADPANIITLIPGTALNGAPNIFEQFILCALVKKIPPHTIPLFWK
jgi:hypothetical protein